MRRRQPGAGAHPRPAHTPEDLRKYPTLDLGPARAQHQWRLTGPQGERVEWEHTPRLVTDDMLMLRTAAIAGAGIVQLPAMMMRDDMLRGELVQLLPGWQPQAAWCTRSTRRAAACCRRCGCCSTIWVSSSPALKKSNQAVISIALPSGSRMTAS